MKQTSFEWAQASFGHANLNDPRRTKRLVSLASSLAKQPGVSVAKLNYSPSEMEGAYRFIRNDSIQATDIADAGFQTTIQKAKEHDLLLALEDSTTLYFSHVSVEEELGHGNRKRSKDRALIAHSILLFAPNSQSVIGLAEQRLWTRNINSRGQKAQRAVRAYEDKESYKWELASRNMAERFGSEMSKVLSVCDREADLYEYLSYKSVHNQRFVVRSMQSRYIEECSEKLYDYVSRLKPAGGKRIHIPQRGGRKARVAELEITYAPVTVRAPAKKTGEGISLYYVGCTERGREEDKLTWHLLTSETITNAADAHRIISYYERRWLVEDYHKTWKTEGTNVESLRMQTQNNLERMITILAFIATRLLELRFIKENKELARRSCEGTLSNRAWKLLWLKQESRELPATAPDMDWLYKNLATLGGWKDTKRTGRASVKVLWEGWFRLQTILEGYELAKSLDQLDL